MAAIYSTYAQREAKALVLMERGPGLIAYADASRDVIVVKSPDYSWPLDDTQEVWREVDVRVATEAWGLQKWG